MHWKPIWTGSMIKQERDRLLTDYFENFITDYESDYETDSFKHSTFVA